VAENPAGNDSGPQEVVGEDMKLAYTMAAAVDRGGVLEHSGSSHLNEWDCSSEVEMEEEHKRKALVPKVYAAQA